MAKAIWDDKVIAESDACIIVEGNHYFPPGSLNRQFFEKSTTTTVCGWKGTAQYFDVVVDGKRNAGAAWYYAEPKDAVKQIRDYVGFWKGIKVE